MIAGVLAAMAGLGVMLAAVLYQRHDDDRSLDELMGMTPPRLDTEDGEARQPEEVSAIVGRAVEMAASMVDRVDQASSLGQTLERAKVPLRPGEFVIVLVAGALGAAAVAQALTGSLPMAGVVGLLSVLLGIRILKRRVNKRRKAFEAQLPDALSLIASSLSSGHTFLRAIQMMCEESGPPLSEEFARVVAETRLGDPTVDSLGRMAKRLEIRDMDMVVQAIRIQQTVGGRLADLLHTLADFIRARDEVRREVKVLTAEGRMSAYVLAGLVPFLFLMMRLVNPEYVKPLYSGSGLILLIGCGVSVVVGMAVILRMVKIEI